MLYILLIFFTEIVHTPMCQWNILGVCYEFLNVHQMSILFWVKYNKIYLTASVAC